MFTHENYGRPVLKSDDHLKTLGTQLVDFWNVLDHPDFPFTSLTSTVNNGRNFPPYNIVEEVDGSVRLEMAVAGYTKDRLSVTLEGNVLNVKGTAPKVEPLPSEMKPEYVASQKPAKIVASAITSKPEMYRHRGISNSTWTRSFEMNQHSIVKDVVLRDGILTVTVTLKEAPPNSGISFEIK